MQARHPSIGQVRGRGLMVGVEFVADRATKEPARDLRNRIIHRCFETGLLMLGCGQSTIRFSPPLMIERARVDEGLEIFERAVSEVERN
jgi:4-aminobutyrate aminotransferase